MKAAAPSISIVTPTYNRAGYLGAAIDSVLGQSYPSLEYVVMDGGSTDGSVEVIRSRESGLAGWVSERDDGQWDALQKGFERTSGEVMGWLNSDDMHTPWTLSVVGEIFDRFAEVEWLTTAYPLIWDSAGRPVRCFHTPGFSRRAFLRGANLVTPGRPSSGWIQQESTFWRRSLWERAGARIDTSLDLAADFELWARFFQEAELYAVETPLAGFRAHGDQKSAEHPEAYREQARAVLARYASEPAGRVESALRARLRPLVPPALVRRRPARRLAAQRHVCRWVPAEQSWELAVR